MALPVLWVAPSQFVGLLECEETSVDLHPGNLWKFSIAPESRPYPKRKVVFQLSLFPGYVELFVKLLGGFHFFS